MKKIIVPLTVLALTATITATPAKAQCHVQKHESLWSIAREYHLDFAELLKLNKHLKNPNLIHPGQHVETQPDKGTGKDGSSSDNVGNGNATDSTTATDRQASKDQAQAILQLVNAERAKAGLQPLQLDEKLDQVATVKAKDMADNHYFSHDSPTFGTPFDMMRNFGVSDYRSAGENIAAGQKSAHEVMQSWMNSSGHRANILNAKYDRLGVGYFVNSSGVPYWVQLFMQR